MSNKSMDLPIHHDVFPYLKEAVLFIQINGLIVDGNKHAYSLLQINEKQSSIYDYLDINVTKKSNHTHFLVELKRQKGSYIEVRAIKTSKDIYCLIMNNLEIEEKDTKLYNHELTFGSAEGVVMFDKNTVIDCDITFANMFGYTLEEIKEKKMDELITGIVNDKYHQVRYVQEKSYELMGRRKDDTNFYIELIEHPYNNQGHVIHVAVVKDITERIENEKRIEYMAYYDELTDLPNRNFFKRVLQDAINTAKKNDELLAVYFIDLDYFKEINDTLGYAFGDKLLQACGERLKSFLETNTFVARMSGDEFLILKRNTPCKDAVINLAEKLISEFEKPIKIDDYEIFTSVSIGISIYPENGETPNELIKHADSAMYVIKEKHRNNYNLFEASITENFKKMLTMETELRIALREEQFELHYQPQKNLQTGKVVGMEALIRWNHPRRGYITPGEFIPLAEKTGLIIEIGDWVLNEACKQNKEWQNRGYQPIFVSVNLSAKQFYQRSLVEKVKNTLNETGLEAQYLELEITESMAMTNEDLILKTMNELRQIGVLVSIDDFGTGYSSFKYLSVFPISKLKIDKMFMNEQQKHNQAIVKSIIHMSHSLNMKVIAEGVETVEQLTFLKNEQCDEMQGFYFSRPLPPEQLTNFLLIG